MHLVAITTAVLSLAPVVPASPAGGVASQAGADAVVIRWSPRDDDGDRHMVVVGTEDSETFDASTFLPQGEIYPRLRLTVTDGSGPAAIDLRLQQCDLVEDGVAECPAQTFVAKLGDGDDVWTADSTLGPRQQSWMFVRGERGADDLETVGWSPRRGVLEGGRGADVLRGGHGLPGRRGTSGGRGPDTILRARQAEGGPGDDTIRATALRNTFKGGPGADRIAGGLGNDRVHGGPGADRIRAGLGSDDVSAGRGHDDLHLREDPAEADAADCGRGRDSVLAGGQDRLTACEVTQR